MYLSLALQGPNQSNNQIEIGFAHFKMGINSLIKDIVFDQEIFEGQSRNGTTGSVHKKSMNFQVTINLNVIKTSVVDVENQKLFMNMF